MSGAPAELPTHPKDVTPAWLSRHLGAWLREGKSATQALGRVVDFTYAPIGTGQVADSYRLTLTWQDAPAHAPPSVVIKCSAHDATSRDTAKAMHLYEIETGWYQHFAAHSGCRCPEPYFVACAAGGADYILLLEDLAPAVQIEQMQGASLEEVQLALHEAAHLHSFRWGDESLRDIAWLNYGQGNQGFVRDFLPRIYPDFCARYQGRLAPEVLGMGTDLIARYDRYSAPRNTPLVLAHGDLRLDNMLYRDGAGRAVVLDWQTVSAGAPMVDIAYCISTSFAAPQQRAAHEEALVAAYLAQVRALQSGGDYRDEDAWQDYRLAAFSGFIMAVVSSMLVQRTPRGDEMFAVMAERSAYQALHLDSLSLV